MNLPKPIEFSTQPPNLSKRSNFIIEFVSVKDNIYTIEIYNPKLPAFRIRGEWMAGCCIEDVKDHETVDYILESAEAALFQATKDGRIVFDYGTTQTLSSPV